MGEYYRNEANRTIPFHPGDNPVPLNTVDWKTRYNELKNRRDWDPKKDFVGLKRLGDSYHPLDPFFKFDGVPPENITFDKIFWPIVGGVGSTAAAATGNWWSRRPFWSALPITIAIGLLGTGIGLYAWHSSRRRAAERDAVLIHYMILHENDFPRIERRKFGQLVRPWYPFRLGTDGLLVED